MYIRKLSELKIVQLFLIIVLALLMTTPAAAQNGGSTAVVSDFLKVYSTSTDKVVQLAEAMSADKYAWRPAEGVRSVGEVLMHVAGANYFFGSNLGAEMPEGVNPQSFDPSSMSKEEIITTLKESVEFMKSTLNTMDSSALDEEINMFGNPATKRQMMYVTGDHAAEHLGQLIAYARMNGVTPPWSQQSE